MCVMDSTDSGAGEFSVGSIVWVRRRNGSWWPGKIVGPEELSTSHLTSPRSGTPVKLLGREDASVDWYNLEKSKRVKAFRCGEFDDCIEKAESAQGMPIKKREKYARREDAILHALELEKQLLKKQGKLGINSERLNSKLSGVVKKELVISSESLGIDNVKLGNSKSHTSHRNDIIGSPMSFERVKEGIQPSGDDDHSEVMPRMRGLQDFGLQIAPTKRKISSLASNGSWKSTFNGTDPALSRGGLSMGRTSHVNGVESTGVICKAKRSKIVYLPAESGESLEYEASPSNHVASSASPVGTRPHAESMISENTSGFTEDDCDSSETDTSESESDSSETEPEMDEDMPLLSEPEVGRYEAQEHKIMVDEDPDEFLHSGDMSHLYSHDSLFASEAVSKWQLKGKRNIRNLTKKSVDATYGKGYNYGPYSEEKTEFIGLEDEYSMASRAATRSRNSVGQNMIDWEDWTWEDRSARNEYWDIKRERFHPVYDGRHRYRRRPKYLIDVDLKVQASYQKEPVPIVSLMSKLNGKAIIGHPIQIEALEDGSSNSLLSTVDEFGEAIDNNGVVTLPHAWRTARRTANVRVPRPHLSSALDGDETADYLRFSDEESRPPFKKLNIGSFSNKASQGKRSLPNSSRLPTDRKFSKKAAKKVILSSSQKTRTISSIPVEQNFSNKPIHHDSSSYQRDGLIKPESSGAAKTVACIPVKLVFSRLLEKINRPPSKAVILLNSEKERNS
ncbi:uncharacterized protein At1g51745-like isoform X2 [Malus sylvestris]|uniref:uncharacterized protein At1g51745-like isoform X2 n=1 Tax=Malus sylvestris TaxID=3752 RepID=UPI0021ABC353|nr:uncharacterized protein At1g51745-like isoform X2 [Malus sylvestris]